MNFFAFLIIYLLACSDVLLQPLQPFPGRLQSRYVLAKGKSRKLLADSTMFAAVELRRK